jgi:type III restriction enzyme
MMRESCRRPVGKCIYTHQGWPARNGGLEEAFIGWCQQDTSIEAFCRISETRHDFVRFRYLREDGLPAFYHPDFLVRTAEAIYLVETKAQGQLAHPNVQRKLKAAANWCRQVNALTPEQRSGLDWHYVLAGEHLIDDWRGKGARMADLLAFSRLRDQIPTDQLHLSL